MKCPHCLCCHVGKLACCLCGATPEKPTEEPKGLLSSDVFYWAAKMSSSSTPTLNPFRLATPRTLWAMRYGDRWVQDPFRVDVSKMSVDREWVTQDAAWEFGR